MNSEEKIDRLTANVVLLVGKVEQRTLLNEGINAQAGRALSQAGHAVNEAVLEIERITSQTVGMAIKNPSVS